MVLSAVHWVELGIYRLFRYSCYVSRSNIYVILVQEMQKFHEVGYPVADVLG